MRRHSEADLVDIVRQALQAFRNEPGDALGRGVAERTVTQRIAVHLQQAFPGLQVDCEYNRNGDGPKYVDIQRAHLTPGAHEHQVKKAMKADSGLTREAVEQWTRFRTTSYPDILIHERGTNDRNLLVIEVKIAGDGRGEDGVSVDVAKLRAFTSALEDDAVRYQYELGLFVLLDETETTFRYFRDGEEIQEHQLQDVAVQAPAAPAGP